MMSRNSDLKQIADELERLTEDKDARLSVTIETGHDEAGLVGTSDAYLRLAKELVAFVAAAERGELEQWDIDEKQLYGSTAISDVFDSSCEVVLDTTCLTNSEQQTQEVSEYFKRLSPPS